MALIKPNHLKQGDKVALVSLSWGGAGDSEIRWRYEIGKRRLKEIFGLNPVEMPHTLAGTDEVYAHPEKRAEDLMNAFLDPEIKGIISCIGGSDSIRMLPYIDFDVIRQNPKVFMGYSDTTVTHFICLKAGLTSFYGPAVLVDFAENVSMDTYTIDAVTASLFRTDPVGKIMPAPYWTSQQLAWVESNKDIRRKYQKNSSYNVIQGVGKVRGHLIGGCIEVIEFMRGTPLFPSLDTFKDAIFFIETSEEKPNPEYLTYWFRGYAAMGILSLINAIIMGKPMDESHVNAYISAIRKVLKEYGYENMPFLSNLTFGHTEPKMVLPYGCLAEIDCELGTFEILESGVI